MIGKSPSGSTLFLKTFIKILDFFSKIAYNNIIKLVTTENFRLCCRYMRGTWISIYLLGPTGVPPQVVKL